MSAAPYLPPEPLDMMNEPNQVTRPRWCPRCRTRMRVSPNPYYGVGLAVHQHLSSCQRCGFVEFVPGLPRDVDAVRSPEPARGTWLERGWRILASRLHVSAR